MAMKMGRVGGFSMYIAPNFSIPACLYIVTVNFWCPGMSSKDVTALLAAVSARPLPLVLACRLILRRIVGRPSLTLY